LAAAAAAQKACVSGSKIATVVALVGVVAATALGASAPAPGADEQSGAPPPALRGRVLDVLPTGARRVALTFDAGGDDAGLPKILRALRTFDVPATFFVTGHFAAYYPAWTRRLAARYAIGNHTMNHLDLTRLSPARARAEIRAGRDAIRRAAGHDTQPLFRFPYGRRNGDTVRLANALGYLPVGWSVDTGGWLGTSGGHSVARVVARVLAGLRPGEIVLMHVGANPYDHTTFDADALPTLIREVERRGYRFTTVAEVYARAFPAWVSQPAA
jgi:peptidoglycan/xylan/chitin deacetylase (PgdA/CDA1 family)